MEESTLPAAAYIFRERYLYPPTVPSVQRRPLLRCFMEAETPMGKAEEYGSDRSMVQARNVILIIIPPDLSLPAAETLLSRKTALPVTEEASVRLPDLPMSFS